MNLIDKRNLVVAPSPVLSMSDKRLFIATQAWPQRRFSAEDVKKLTGDDPAGVRYPYSYQAPCAEV